MKYIIIFIILLVALLAWCPWLSAQEASGLIDTKIATLEATTPNLCPINVKINSMQKVFFGYSEEISYDCTLTDSIYGVQKSTNVVFVTFYKSLLGMPKPIIQK